MLGARPSAEAPQRGTKRQALVVFMPQISPLNTASCSLQALMSVKGLSREKDALQCIISNLIPSD